MSNVASACCGGEVAIAGPHCACLFNELAMEMIGGRHYSILQSLAHHEL